MQQQHMDEGPGPVLVAEPLPGQVPETLVSVGEGPGPAGMDEGTCPGQCSGLEVENLQIMVEVEHFGPFADGPGMACDHTRSVHGRHVGGPQADIDATTGIADRD